ncbi:zinc-binding oxidoreductase [Tothia fuscella]|uniref:Zinc-binding oxidoreductase n=1 Tax=Tothia fuscella TaxID=1048955 RepID=A0A9P4U258_9PEZI|nr:zinc-binding oxidoreductase [Tothia fuscella]
MAGHTEVPSEIKAIIHDPKTHKLTVSRIPTPKPSSTEYLVKVHCVGITNGELLWPEPCSLTTPIPGFDVVGNVVTSPSPNSKFQPGDEVYALTSFSRQGNAREYTVIDESEIAGSTAAGWSRKQAASVPMSALTAWQALFEKGGLEEGKGKNDKSKKVLIIGASGAVGIWAVQLAKWVGAHVTGMCGPSNVDWVKNKLGADEVLNYTEVSLKDYIGEKEKSRFDLVLDCVGGESLKDAWRAVKKEGLMICIVQPVDGAKPDEGVSDGVKGLFFIVEPSGKQCGKITAVVKEEGLQTQVDGDKVWLLEDYEKAFERVASGHARGKVVLSLISSEE